jgi:hypothetical protein
LWKSVITGLPYSSKGVHKPKSIHFGKEFRKFLADHLLLFDLTDAFIEIRLYANSP